MARRAIKVGDMKVGMKFKSPIYHKNGKVLLSADTELTEGIIKILKGRNIAEVYIDEPKPPSYLSGEPREITLAQAREGMVLAQPIQKDGKVLMEAGTTLGRAQISRLKEWGVPALVVRVPTKEERAAPTPLQERERAKQESKEVHDEAMVVVKDTINAIVNGREVDGKSASEAVSRLVDETLENKEMLIGLTSIKSMDNYLFAHSVNVCVFALITGTALGYTKGDLMELGTGALLHDIGMTRIPREIIDKTTPLSEEEMDRIRGHVEYGIEIVDSMGGMGESIKRAIREHHERENGSGYVRGLKGEDVHEFAKILGVVDVFEALTAPRAYRDRLLSYDAMRTVLSLSVELFDKRIVRAFLENVAIYPVNSMVELNTGEVAVVVGTNEKVPFRPVIKLIFDDKKKRISDLKIINLLNDRGRFIKRILNEEDYGIKIIDVF
ncbi:MAG: HD domain-containing phosphohydrolase [bacterium]